LDRTIVPKFSLKTRIHEKRNSINPLWKTLFYIRDSARFVKTRLRPDFRLRMKVKAQKISMAKMRIPYKDNPKLSFIVLSFNHRNNIKPIIEGLRLTPADEIIVCEDGSIDGSLQEWVKYLNRPNDFLIRSNDIHEIRAYNRAISLARGQIVCILQDDDIPPDNSEWAKQALDLFRQHPKLAVIGGYRSNEFISEGSNRFGYKGSDSSVKKIPYLDPHLKVPFMFVSAVCVGPIFYRKDVWMQLGGFNLKYSKPGKPGIIFDDEICIRAWQKGWQVGLYGPPEFEKYVGGSGTSKYFDINRRHEIERKNKTLLRDSYKDEFNSIAKLAQNLNNTLDKE